MKKISLLICLLFTMSISLAPVASAKEELGAPTVTVPIKNGKGEQIGTARFTQRSEKVYIALEAEKLPPGKHGIHIHNVGLCEAPDFKSAEGHFNPGHKEHGFNNPKGFHDGDLPNIEVGADGKVKTEMVTSAVTLEQAKKNSLLKEGGTSLIIHAGPDDYVTDPSGNSGDRIACGVIK
ncbi:superoxide dismutase family protein [Paenibacillus sp. HB172176]|uniref:superoxide dismutase family protein n=1 Tax=Paenibacillus sp. HB172176 TaxID=2493690 RepID=UPI00143BB62E|nr:superoxide dismutase family protein [Paenibacillus sp. HB172176]